MQIAAAVDLLKQEKEEDKRGESWTTSSHLYPDRVKPRRVHRREEDGMQVASNLSVCLFYNSATYYPCEIGSYGWASLFVHMFYAI